jgi:hypothetical protein
MYMDRQAADAAVREKQRLDERERTQLLSISFESRIMAVSLSTLA